MDLSDLFASFSAGRHGQSRPGKGQDFEASTTISLEDAYAGITVDLSFVVQEVDAQSRVQRVPHTFKARIPKGVTDGQRLLLRGKGGKGSNGGADGDLYLNIHFAPHPLFKPSGHDLLMDLPLTPWEAMLGASIKVPTLQGGVTLKVPAGSKSGQKFRISKHGMPKKNEGHGDLYAIAQVVVPAKLTEEEQALVEKLAAVSTFNPRSHFA